MRRGRTDYDEITTETPELEEPKRKSHPIRRLFLLLIGLLVVMTLLQTDGFPKVDGLIWETQDSSASSGVPEEPEQISQPAVAEEEAWSSATSSQGEENGGLIVCIDPGHGGKDSGCTYQELKESEQVLELALAVRDAMVRRGVQVVMTREDDTFVELEERANIANQAGADFFLSIHRNSLEYGSASGIEIWHSSHASSATIAYAECVERHLVAAGVSKSRGCKGGSQTSPNEDYAVCRLTEMPAILVEMGFMSDGGDNSLFETNMEAYAEAFTDAVLESWEAGQAA